MAPDEKQLLERFLADMVAARAGPKDPEAENLIRDAASRQPDAVYLLVQRAVQLDQALQLREAQVRKLEDELAQAKAAPAASGSFIGDPYAWGARPSSPAPAAAVQQPAMPQAGGAPQAVGAPLQANARPAGGGWGGGGMLGTVAGAAAGVVAGGFLYQGIQGLMHRNDPPAASAAGGHDPAAHGLVGDSSGFDTVVPDDSDIVASGDDDNDVV